MGPQTRIIASLIKELTPDIFLDVHSGTKGLFMPYDWTTDPIANKADREHMQAVLQDVSHDCPECMVGPCAETIGYLAPGSSADYAYSQGVAFSFIWEIYTDDSHFAEDASRRQAFLARKNSVAFLQRGVGAFTDVDTPSWAANDEAFMAPMEEEAKEHCLQQFNPLTQSDYDSTVARWMNAFGTLCSSVRRIKEGS